ncbi:carboxypeptidase regulatory-like domain-containing protein [Natronorubrum texcoconense]|uniref:Carboxypeptidase regulatory-like domain-containing protein n=1 Tax=Natronorubrum texcoconense TaxID=1095776 RepID=A0A1G8V1U1_9EURY|nr:carboxypeptidase regulatory-like domain-containing protein [Natronorubrum texcoconense]SDJ60062.1 Carboxypeptidase regulatory-like domain-containing protein [Natronorubrum texcoconense]
MHSDRRTFIQRSSLVTAGLLATAGTTNAVGATSQSEETGRVEGRLAYGGTPVEDVTVTFDGEHDTDSASNGSYERELVPGTYTLAVDSNGYVADSEEINLEAGETVTADFDLRREWGPDKGELEVAVIEDGGGSTIDSRVTIYGNGEEHSVIAPGGRVPDNDRWRRGFVVAEGWWEVRASDADGYGDGYDEVYVEADESVRSLVELPDDERTIHPDGWVSGTVADESGEPIPNAMVRLKSDRSTMIERTSETGEFTVELPHGQYTLDVSESGYERLETDVAVRFGRVTEQDVTLEAE